MDLDKLLRDAKPELTTDLSRQHALILSTLALQQAAPRARRSSWLVRFGRAVLEAPIPTLSASAVVLSLIFWQTALLLGADDALIGRVAAFLIGGGFLP